METDEFYANPFWYRLFYMVPIFMVFRTRLYMAWLLSECICISAGFGAYPVTARAKCGTGPTVLKALEDVYVFSSLLVDSVEHIGVALRAATRLAGYSFMSTLNFTSLLSFLVVRQLLHHLHIGGTSPLHTIHTS